MVGYCVRLDIDIGIFILTLSLLLILILILLLISILLLMLMKKLIMYWWWGIAFGLMDESVPRQEMEDYHPDTRVTTFNLEKYGHLQERTATAF